METAPKSMKVSEGEENRCMITLPIEYSTPTFDLEKTVCSHGLFMMAPNLWVSSSKTLQRPLRLADATTTVTVRISQHAPSSSLHIWVLGPHSLSLEDQDTIKAQVARMLRISKEEDRKITEFHKIHDVAKERGFGRVFRSSTLFEDMAKCILLCNCQWSRTLSMARALCELQFELKGAPLGWSTAVAAYLNETFLKADALSPKTPAPRESKRKRGKRSKTVNSLIKKFVKNDSNFEIEMNSGINCSHSSTSMNKASPSIHTSVEEDSYNMCNSLQLSIDSATDACSILDPQSQGGRTSSFTYRIGDFPSPEELANIDENYLAKRCKLGYRAKRILELARSIVEHRLQIPQLEDRAKISDYDELAQQFLGIQGFGHFTCANVLMCMGFYQSIPADAETIRHLKQFHARSECTIQNVHRYVEEIYGKYAPFQFLAYWLELWDFYEKRFGKMSEMHHSNYQLITASNMRTKTPKRVL